MGVKSAESMPLGYPGVEARRAFSCPIPEGPSAEGDLAWPKICPGVRFAFRNPLAARDLLPVRSEGAAAWISLTGLRIRQGLARDSGYF